MTLRYDKCCDRESGVRNLKKLLEKIYRKVAFKLVKRQGKEAQASSASAATEDSSGPDTAEAPSGNELAVFCAQSVLVRCCLVS